jgi:hypothetical protein
MMKHSADVVEITRDQLVRILGEQTVRKAETLPEEVFQERKWERLQALLHAYEKVYHTSLFEALRSYLTGLDDEMKVLLVRHIFDQQKVSEL